MKLRIALNLKGKRDVLSSLIKTNCSLYDFKGGIHVHEMCCLDKDNMLSDDK